MPALPGQPRPSPSPQELEHAVGDALLRIWWVRLAGQLFIAGVLFVTAALVGVAYLGQTQIASMLDTREKITSAGDSIMLQVQKVRDAAAVALPQIANDAQSVKRDAEEAARTFAAIGALEAELRAKTAALDSLLQSGQPLTPRSVWSMSDKMLKGVLLLLGLCLGVLLLDLVLRVLATIRQLPD